MELMELEKAIARLAPPARYALAAKLAERAVREVEADEAVALPDPPAFHRAVELLWRQAEQGGVDYDREAAGVHREVAALLPEDEDAPWPTLSVMSVASVVDSGLQALQRPRDAPLCVARQCNDIWDALCEPRSPDDEDRIIDRETAWQERAIRHLAGLGDAPVTRTVFDAVPEPEFGPHVPPEERAPDEREDEEEEED